MNLLLTSSALVILLAALATPTVAEQAISGYDFLTPEMQAMQDDDFANPGMTAVENGKTLFATPGKNGKSCAACHGDDGSKLNVKHIAAYPVYSAQLKGPLTLRKQILRCRNQRMGGPPLRYGDKQAIQLEAFVRRLAVGQPVAVDVSGPMAPYYATGKKLFHTRWGQVDIACHQCHDYHAGQTFRGQKLTQGQSNGFPVYRFTTGQVVGVQERISECLTNLRAEPYPLGSAEYDALEVYMNARGNGLKIETPGIRY
ncbi:MAG: sulfur oxidation c-type cytochrome SoxA [Gammaproteobacteria bacterium]|nr:sulfur oxidation c-type cytochrome SoxA [Gammaproteobacteria bacterium]